MPKLKWPLILIAANGLFVALAALLWAGSEPLPAARFEYGVEREWSGAFQRLPYPSILLDGAQRALLVAPGKRGADDLVAGLRDGQGVTARGSLIERDGRRMIEVSSRPASAAPVVAAAGSASPPAALGRVELRGEIVDTKCFLGVMNPGSGKVHRGCAARCIRGGIPPMLFTTAGRYVLLDGLSAAEAASLAAEPVTVAGELFSLDGKWLVLRTSSANAKGVTFK